MSRSMELYFVERLVMLQMWDSKFGRYPEIPKRPCGSGTQFLQVLEPFSPVRPMIMHLGHDQEWRTYAPLSMQWKRLLKISWWMRERLLFQDY